MGIADRRRQLAVPQQLLYDPEIGAGFQHVRREAVPQGVEGCPLSQPRLNPGLAACRLKYLDVQRSLRRTWEYPNTSTRPIIFPVSSKKAKQYFREHDVAVFASLALFNSNDHTGAVDITGLQRHYLRDPKSCGVGADHGHPAHCVRNRRQEALNLTDAEDHGQFGALARVWDHRRNSIAPQRHTVKEAQRRHRLIEGAPSKAAPGQMDQVGARVFQRQSSGRTKTKVPAVPNQNLDIRSWGRQGQIADHHVICHPTTEGAHLGHLGYLLL